MEATKFSFNDYDVIGFDLDNTLARYKVGNLISLEYDIIINFLVRKGYPGDILLKPPDTNFPIRGLIIDDKNGNLVRISPDGTILQATHGSTWLSEEELLEYYPTRHLSYIDTFVKNPVSIESWSFAEKMRISLDYFDIPNSLVFARAVDTVDKLETNMKLCDIWSDIISANFYMFSTKSFDLNTGEYFPQIKNNPDRYYYKCTKNVIDWLENLKKNGKQLFLITGSDMDYASYSANYTLGDDWKKFFDIIIFEARKPGFFTKSTNFTSLQNINELDQKNSNALTIGGMYKRGNWKTLKEFFSKMTNNANPKFLYIGDNLVQDLYAPKVYCNCDAVVVCEELSAEKVFGYTEEHPDKDFLCSTLWGSYFRFKNNSDVTNWYTLLKKYSKIAVPSIEYLAKFSVDHKFNLFAGR